MIDIKIAQLPINMSSACQPEGFGYEMSEKVQKFHSSFPEYQATPLVNLKHLAKELNVSNIYVKDESYRFGLNAFKVLGGSYCIANYIAEKAGISIDEMTYERLLSEEIRNKTGDLTFITATDGNHGRGIAWTANRLKQNSIVYMPKGSAKERLDNIKALATNACITEYNYDDTVRKATKDAQESNWILVQDTSWDGYEQIPKWIMQGYLTLGNEIVHQLNDEDFELPTHIFLQAGVGSMAAAIAAFFVDVYKNSGKTPIITIVEPDKADCFYKTAAANDGKIHIVDGEMKTIMAGLACGEPCTIAWDILKEFAEFYISMPDEPAANGMRRLGHPLDGDTKIISGESGASAIGFVIEVLQNPELQPIKEQLRLNSKSRILCISTEGDTDKENYKKIVES